MLPILGIPEITERMADRQRSIPPKYVSVRDSEASRPDPNVTLMVPGHRPASQTTRRVKVGGDPIAIVIALLFARPNAAVIQELAQGHKYFDLRTGDAWDLFFPGYYRDDGRTRVGADDYFLGTTAGSWWFSYDEFDQARREISDETERRWIYSGGADLVLASAMLPSAGPLTIDWTSVISGPLTDEANQTLTLSAAIERISSDIEQEIEDKYYGVAEVIAGDQLNQEGLPGRQVATGVFIAFLSEAILKALGLR